MTQRMESSLTRKLGIYIMTLLVLAVVTNSVPFLLSSSYAACQLDENVNQLNIGRKNMILYWEEQCFEDQGTEKFVKYQTSSNKGKTWSAVHTLVSFTEPGSLVDFDGIIEAGRRGRLVASFAVIEDEGKELKLKVMTSDNYGQDWNGPDLIWNISGTIPGSRFLHCPALSSKFDPKSKVFTQLTTIVEETDEGDKAYIYLVNSRDGGKSWDAPLQLGKVPASDWCGD